MKKTIVGLFAFLSLGANAGEAFIPKFTHAASGNWCVTVSNVSNVDVDVTVEAFISSGAKYTGPSVNNGVQSQFNSPFTLTPSQTTLLCTPILAGVSEHGYAKIKTKPSFELSNSNAFVVASSYWSSGHLLMNIPVNSGLPF